VVDAVGLTAAGAYLDIVREASLGGCQFSPNTTALPRRTYSHCGMQRPGNLVVLLQSGAATKNLRQPELADGTFHVPDLPLHWRRCLDPLRRLPADTAYHIRMRERFGCSLSWLRLVHRTRHRLGDPGVQRRRAIRNDQVVVVTADRSRLAGTRPRGEGRRHGVYLS